ncbi:MAG TPA: hypothetical protein VE650_09695 [Acetobacteraceae bacterium]|nr:hypothetical protein [Acetobacteraceae bacterium]
MTEARNRGEEQVPESSPPPAPREAVADLRMRSVEAFPVSFRVPQDRVVRHGIGAAVKRDTVLVKVVSECVAHDLPDRRRQFPVRPRRDFASDPAVIRALRSVVMPAGRAINGESL